MEIFSFCFVCGSFVEKILFIIIVLIMKMKLVYVYLAVCSLFAISDCLKDKAPLDDYCYVSDKQHLQYAHFNSLTAYDFIRGTDLETQSEIPSKYFFFHKLFQIFTKQNCFVDCKATKIWMIIRHGTRMPRPNSISHLIKLEDVSFVLC